MNNIFGWLTDQIRNTEHAVVTFIAAVIPWLVPIVPAYLTGYHVIYQLGLPDWSGWVIGIVVEGLGIASMSRMVAFWENNRKYSKETNKMPIAVPFGTYIWYLAVVILVNVALESAAGASPVRLWTIGLLATLSVPTAMLISINSIWTERLQEKDRLRLERKQERLEKLESSRNFPESSESFQDGEESSETFQKLSRNFPKDWRKLRPLLEISEVSWFANLSPMEFSTVAERYGVTEKTIQNWKIYAQTELSNMESEDAHIQ